MFQENLRLVITGAPGCGKGTHAKLIAEKEHICHLSTGQMLREMAQKDTAFGRELKKSLSGGNFASDDVVEKMIFERTLEPDCSRGFILDGFPRNVDQAVILMKIMEKRQHKLNGVLVLDVPDEMLIDRTLGRYICSKCGAEYHEKYFPPKVYGVCDKCGRTDFVRRSDDNKKTVEKRLEDYRKLTYPILSYFEEKNVPVFRILGTGSIDQTAKKIASILQEI